MNRRILVITLSFLACGMVTAPFAQGPSPVPAATARTFRNQHARPREANAMTRRQRLQRDLKLTAQIRRANCERPSRFRCWRTMQIISRKRGESRLRDP